MPFLSFYNHLEFEFPKLKLSSRFSSLGSVLSSNEIKVLIDKQLGIRDDLNVEKWLMKALCGWWSIAWGLWEQNSSCSESCTFVVLSVHMRMFNQTSCG